MKRTVIALTAGLALLAGAAPAPAMLPAPAPIPVRVAGADAVVVGKLGKVEDKTASAAPVPGAKKVDYQVLTLKVEEGILGARKGDEIRLGFVLPTPPPPGVFRSGGGRAVVYSPGQEGLFFLTKHADESFYVAPMYFSFTGKQNANYAKELELTKRCVKLLDDPLTGLKSKEAEDRLLTAAMLISRYRQYRPGDGNPPKTEAIPADESKLILNVLAESDWTAKAGGPLGYLTPQGLFNQLGATDKDGWVLPKAPPAVQIDAARKWLKEHADTYRIQRFVHARAEK
jgi:hypothetical protein